MSILSDHIDDIIDTLLDEAEDPQAVFDTLRTSLDVAASSRGLDTVSTEATVNRPRFDALFRLLVDAGDMTPMAVRQINNVFDEEQQP